MLTEKYFTAALLQIKAYPEKAIVCCWVLNIAPVQRDKSVPTHFSQTEACLFEEEQNAICSLNNCVKNCDHVTHTQTRAHSHHTPFPQTPLQPLFFLTHSHVTGMCGIRFHFKSQRASSSEPAAHPDNIQEAHRHLAFFFKNKKQKQIYFSTILFYHEVPRHGTRLLLASQPELFLEPENQPSNPVLNGRAPAQSPVPTPHTWPVTMEADTPLLTGEWSSLPPRVSVGRVAPLLAEKE